MMRVTWQSIGLSTISKKNTGPAEGPLSDKLHLRGSLGIRYLITIINMHISSCSIKLCNFEHTRGGGGGGGGGEELRDIVYIACIYQTIQRQSYSLHHNNKKKHFNLYFG